MVQVNCDSEDGKIDTSWLHLGEAGVAAKLSTSLHRMKGFNLRSYGGHGRDGEGVAAQIAADFASVSNPVFFDVALSLKSLRCDAVFGLHNNMKRINRLSQTGAVTWAQCSAHGAHLVRGRRCRGECHAPAAGARRRQRGRGRLLAGGAGTRATARRAPSPRRCGCAGTRRVA